MVAEGKELSQLLMEFKIVKVLRDCNKVANELARRNTLTVVGVLAPLWLPLLVGAVW